MEMNQVSEGREFAGIIRANQSSRANQKGRDIGYGLAASSCEGVDDVDACTVTAPDAIAAFAVPNPNGTSQVPVGFFGFGRSSGRPAWRITQSTLDWRLIIFANPFDRRRAEY